MQSRIASCEPVIGVPEFWLLASRAEHTLLALDYDGTLAPFHVDPMQARPLPGVRGLLKALGKVPSITVAIISGRPVQEASSLLGVPGIVLVGCHGFEIIDSEGNLTVKSPSREQVEALDRAMEAALRLHLGDRLEVKTASIALHTRGIPAKKASKIEAAIFREWTSIASSDLGCRRFKGGVEIHCTGWHKGHAFGELLGNLPPMTFPVYVGDDSTDEDVFRALRKSGIGIKVGSPQAATAAKGFLPNCEAVRAFLRSWLSLPEIEGSKAHHGNQKAGCGFKSVTDSCHAKQSWRMDG